MNTTLSITTGDVIEFADSDGIATALVLLAADDNLILDRCDGSTPFVVHHDELDDVRVFEPGSLELAA